jgi:D-lactate dehydrogenase
MNVALFNTKSYEKEYFEKFKTSHQIDYLPAPLNEQTVSLCSRHQAACAFVNDTINRRVIEHLADLGVNLIAMRCAGYNNVDMEAASSCSIKVVGVPAYSPYAVAEYAVALILTLNRKTHKAYNRVREGNFSLERLMGFDLHGKTVGVIGTGKIAIFSMIMKGFGQGCWF